MLTTTMASTTGGASLKAAIDRVEAKGVVVIYGNSSGEPRESAHAVIASWEMNSPFSASASAS